MHASRRDILAAAGASTLLVALGCRGGGGKQVERPKPITGADVRAWLRRAVGELMADYASVAAHAAVVDRIAAGIDLRGRGLVRDRHAAVVIRAVDRGGNVVERSTGELSDDGVAKLVGSLRRGGSAPATIDFGTPQRDGPTAADRGPDAGWLAMVDDLDKRAAGVSTSRVVYRGAWIDRDDATVWHVAPGIDREQRLIRGRVGVVLVTWSGNHPMIGAVDRGAAGGPHPAAVTDDDLAKAARGALELVTPGPVPAGSAVVVLTPPVVARLADAGIAAMMTTAAWTRPDLAARAAAGKSVAAASVTIADDPMPARYGGYHFDDDGVAAVRAPLIEGGIVRSPVAAAARAGHVGLGRPQIGHLVWTPGVATDAALIGGIDDGWIIEGVRAARVDPVSWSVVIDAARARRVHNGVETGHVHADVELAGTMPGLLGAITGTSSTTELVAIRDGEATGDARWRSLDVPWLATRAMVAPRRRRA